jgi:hypothetical protein
MLDVWPALRTMPVMVETLAGDGNPVFAGVESLDGEEA